MYHPLTVALLFSLASVPLPPSQLWQHTLHTDVEYFLHFLHRRRVAGVLHVCYSTTFSNEVMTRSPSSVHRLS